MDALSRLVAVEEIREVVLRYCRGLDRLDADLLRSAYVPGALDDHGVFVGDAAEFCERVLASHSRYDASMHCVLNHLVELDGPDDARGEAYVLAHVLRKDDEGVPVHDAWWGRYADRYERRGGGGGTAPRAAVQEWTRREPLGRPMRADTGVFRQGFEDRGTGAALGPGAFSPRSAAEVGDSGAPA